MLEICARLLAQRRALGARAEKYNRYRWLVAALRAASRGTQRALGEAVLGSAVGSCLEVCGVDLTNVLSGLARERGEALERQARFVSGDHYHRELVHCAPGLEIWLLSWLPGQISPIHDHGGIITVTQVLSGSVFEERYERTGFGNLVRPSWSNTRVVGDIDPIDPSEIHRVTPVVPTVTLHLYAPGSCDGNVYETALAS